MDPLDELFCNSVLYYYRDSGDPTRLCDWDEARCERLMPAFFYAWRQVQQAKIILDAVVDGL